MIGARERLALVEYGAPIDLAGAIVAATGLDRSRAGQILLDAGSRVARSLGFSSNPLSVEPRGSRAIDFAGLIRLGPSLELEVAPKFLGVGADSPWREDFFFLSTLSRHGRLLATERLSASGGAPRDLSTLVARSIAGMYEARKRRPLRSYRRVSERSFFLDGDPDPVDLVFPDADGFAQDTVKFDRSNAWNATIRAASLALIPEVREPGAAAGLMRVAEDLAPQAFPAATRKRIPARHAGWAPLYELSADVLEGLGMSYRTGRAHAPGYLVSTWQVWEDLLTIAARLGFGRAAVFPQRGFTLGSRRKASTEAATTLSVIPDCYVESNGAFPSFLLDAKYKGHVERGLQRMAEADVYESMAFARAADKRHVVLAYPALPNGPAGPVGTCTAFERIEIGDLRIIGVQIEARGISSAGGLRSFASKIAMQIPALLD